MASRSRASIACAFFCPVRVLPQSTRFLCKPTPVWGGGFRMILGLAGALPVGVGVGVPMGEVASRPGPVQPAPLQSPAGPGAGAAGGLRFPAPRGGEMRGLRGSRGPSLCSRGPAAAPWHPLAPLGARAALRQSKGPRRSVPAGPAPALPGGRLRPDSSGSRGIGDPGAPGRPGEERLGGVQVWGREAGHPAGDSLLWVARLRVG